MPIAVPEQWPQDVVDKYEPVRSLGTGGFASVVLAKRKEAEEGKPKFVAIKVVGSKDVTRQEVGYAHRELDILQELNHSHVMKVVEHWEPKRKDHLCAAIMALSYAKGPTLERLLNKGGALSFAFGRLACAQLVDVMVYLHSRAVLHRDIKPDNIIMVGANYEQPEIWDEVIQESEVKDWGEYRKKWHLQLVDFGFARALSPSDMNKKMPSTSTTSTSMDGSARSAGSSGRRSSLSKSISRAFNRQMSALGNRNYAAPEIMRGVKPNSKHKGLKLANDQSVHLTDNLAEGLSQYGMMAEAFSVGYTIRYSMTGVPPNKTYNEVIAAQKGGMAKLGRLFGRKKKQADGNAERKPKYRSMLDVPAEAGKLINGLTQTDAEQRTSIRSARLYPWIDDVLETDPIHDDKLDFLSFVLQEEENIKAASTAITATED